MKLTEQKKALKIATQAAAAAGEVMRKNHRAVKKINDETQHDIKLELDVRCQKIIERALIVSFPEVAVLGEEGVAGDPNAQCRWVIDPIDGTVNFTYGIPHCCVSIALQSRDKTGKYQTIVGVVYDPFCNEMWTAIRGEPAKLNGKNIKVSSRKKLNEAIVSIGFAKSKETMEQTLPYFNRLVPRIRKIRMMGAAALSLVYVASGRFDGYVEKGIRLWDIAAGGLILECAGGEFWHELVDKNETYRMIATNGLLRKQLEKV
ncbi:MAG: inositol monophosphatase [Verrucomicrobia bacterium]|nr:inositol monophosphatase [Verrucomicrobiota bacterium]